MRRPLCFAALVYILSVLLLLHITPLSGEDTTNFEGQSLQIEATVCAKEYKRSEDGTVKLLVTLKKVQRAGDTAQKINEANAAKGESPGKTPEGADLPQERLLCRVGDGTREGAEAADDALGIGDQVTAKGTFHSFESATNHGVFDQKTYYQTLGICGQLTGATIEKVQATGENRSFVLPGEYFFGKISFGEASFGEISFGGISFGEISFGERLHRIKRRLCTVLDRCLSEENAGILKAMLLGDKGSLDPEIKSLYQVNGIIHVLSISGLHISILGMGCYRVLKKLCYGFLDGCSWLRREGRKRHAAAESILPAVLSAAFICIYGQMTGMGASTIRALVMFCLHLLAGLLHRTYDLLTALSIAGVLLVMGQPLYLMHSGFLFSFSAVLGIALLTPAFSCKAMKGLSVSLATLPVYLMFYYRFPLYSILLNLFVIPLAGTVMAGGLLVLALGSVWLPLGKVIGLVPSGILGFYAWLCRTFEHLPGQQVNLGAPGTAQVVIYIMALALIAGRRFWMGKIRFFRPEEPAQKGLPSWKRQELFSIFLAAAAVFILCLRVRSGLSLHVIDVGQGDGMLLQAEGANILIDGGSTDETDVGKYRLIPLLQYYGVRELSCIVTHEDADHISGVKELMESSGETGSSGIRITCLYLPSTSQDAKTTAFLELEELAAQSKVPVQYLAEGAELSKGRLRLLCLHPEAENTYTEPNERSVTLYLTYGEFTCLLNGDLEGEGEKRLITKLQEQEGSILKNDLENAKTPVTLTLLHVAHHGSNGATSEEFLKCFRPLYAFVSCGEGNRYGHPGEEAMERLRAAGVQQIYDTRYCGEITFRTDGKKLRVQTFTGM